MELVGLARSDSDRMSIIDHPVESPARPQRHELSVHGWDWPVLLGQLNMTSIESEPVEVCTGSELIDEAPVPAT